jgi:hypothetical protein
MRCLQCEYDLRGLPAGSCPECGSAFDPRDPSSFWSANSPGARLAKSIPPLVVITSAMVPVLHVLAGHLALVVARLSLGHWPDRNGKDDPKYINFAVDFLHSIWMLLTVLLLPAMLAWLVCVAATMFPRDAHEETSMLFILRKPIVLLTLLAWLAAAPIILVDPASIAGWMFD